ncbi:MAG: response regulator [Xanthomonadales bacterium]|jgi:two-component system response regulator BaeR|nr:response regulator [Xanthomonadales bacterium]
MEQQQTCIMIVEDEPKIAGLLEDYLSSRAGFRCRIVDRGDEVLERFRADPPALVLLDLMLPGLDGIEVCKRLRAESDVPIIMVTARTEEIDRLLGLELGADDYICKPFSPREVVARVKAVLRRTSNRKTSPPQDGLSMDRERFAASLNGQPLDLTPVEFALLEALQSRPGRVLSREQLLDYMYSDYRVVSDRAVDTHVKNLRKKLNAVAPELQTIESVYGLGYRFTPVSGTAGKTPT